MIISQKSSCHVDDQNSISGRPQLFSGRHWHEDTPIFLAWLYNLYVASSGKIMLEYSTSLK